MGCNVYANGDEIACKAGDNKVIAAMPDVCLSPPSPPAGPIPVPYPNTSFSKDTQNGSKTVMIKSKEVMLKNQSFYKTSPLGDEAATQGLGAGVITHVITGKTYCVAWSMDVKFEGLNVDRHTDLTTSNNASPVANRALVAPTTAGSAPPPDPNICQCCKGPVHSTEQRNGESMTEEQWYNPDDEARKKKPPTPKEKEDMEYAVLLRAEARAKNCPVVHSDPNDPCAKHYAVKDQNEKKGIDKEYNESLRPLPKDMQKDPYIYEKRYGKGRWKRIRKRMAKLEQKMKAEGTSIAHITPRGAGGCPFGTNNVKVVPKGECAVLESELGKVQGTIRGYHKR